MMTEEPEPRPRELILYRWWDISGRLLYVGKSISLFNRITQHRRSSGFFEEAAAMTMERFGSTRQLAEAEMTAIRTENPVFNIIGGRHAPEHEGRKIFISDLDPHASGYWAPIDYARIQFGDVIRWSLKSDPTKVDGQGIVDDYDYDEDDQHFWIIFTETGGEIELDGFMAARCNVKRWVHTAGDPVVAAYKKAAIRGLAGEEDHRAR